MARDSRWKNQFELVCPEQQLEFEVRCCLYWYIIIPALSLWGGSRTISTSGQWPVISSQWARLITDHLPLAGVQRSSPRIKCWVPNERQRTQSSVKFWKAFSAPPARHSHLHPSLSRG